MLVLLLLCLLATFIFSLSSVQTRLANYATNTINKDFGTNLQIDKLKVNFITWNTSAKGIYAEDEQKDTLFYIGDLTTSILDIKNLVKGQLEFGDINVDNLHLKLKTYKGESSSNLEVFIDKLDDKKPRAEGAKPFKMVSGNVNIGNSRFQLIDENLEKPQQLDFKNLNIGATDFLILGPDVSTQINTLTFTSRRGPKVENLTTAFKYSRTQMRFDALQIKTKESDLKGNLVFNYDRKDFKDFINKVQIDANFADSEIALDDINMLYNQFGSGKKISLSTNVSGVLNDLSTKKLMLFSDNTGVRGDFNFKNLFTLSKPYVIDADMKSVTTSYYELRSLLPNILGKVLPSSFSKFGQFTVRGTTSITQTLVSAKVNINTAIGSSYSDVELTNINNIDNANYHGFISLIDFDLGKFLDNKTLGKATVDINVDGNGFVAETMNTEITGEVYSIKFNNYVYKNIKVVSGTLKEQFFDGALLSNDPNLKLNFKGLADFSSDNNTFDFIASVDYANFKALNFINDSVSVFKGNINMDITGNTLDNIVGAIKFRETSYQNKNDTYYFEDFEVTSNFETDSLRKITINSPDIITGYLEGNFKVNELDKLIQNSIGSIYTNYRPFKISEGQKVNFKFNIYNKIVDVFFPKVKFGSNTFIRGKVVADKGDFKLTFKSPQIEAYGNKLDSINVKIDNKNPLFNTFISVNDATTNFYDVKDFKLINTKLKDTLFFRTEFAGGRGYDDTYYLNFYHTFNKNNRSVIGLKRSSILLKGNEWVVNKNRDKKNKVIVNRTLDSIDIKEIVFNNNANEQIRLSGKVIDSTYKDLLLEFSDVSLHKITPALKNLELKGEVNGSLNIYQEEGKYLPSSSLTMTDFTVNDIRLGNLGVEIVGNDNLTSFDVETHLRNKGQDRLVVAGEIINKNSSPTADLDVEFSDFLMEPFSNLGEGILSNIRGSISGKAKITESLSNPDISGKLLLDKAGLAIDYLNVDYSFANNSVVNLYKQTFDFEDIQLTDVTKNTTATLDGTISHKEFAAWDLDLNVNTNNNRFLILNTDFSEESLYYGTGYLNGTGKIYGSTKALNIDVIGATAKGTSLKIPLSDVATVGDYSFINFVTKQTEEDKRRELQNYEGLELMFDLDVTPEAEVEIVIDPNTKSSLKGTGGGTILMEINTNDKFNMYGEFAVATGEYNYKYGGIINRKFTVEPGGTIIWDGSPLNAEVNMRAIYSLDANPAPLLDNSDYTNRIPVDVVVSLQGELEKPEVDFNIEFPSTSSIVKSELEYRLLDHNFEQNNAFYLLMQGTFVNEESGLNATALSGNLTQTASGLLNSVFKSNGENLDLGIVYEQGNLNPNAIQTENRVGVTVSTKLGEKILFNGKFGVPVGGVGESVVAGDMEVQIILNDKGTLSAKVFNRENEIQQFLAERQGYTQGVGLSYQVDFDTFKELMTKIFPNKARKEEEPKVEENSKKPQN
ncbi:translocation/assembly module TamB domain-containing protein [Cellulophaga lytica]|uniref:translocation/assembly module TamB domain-containing protein n=1 Tax=Cellulophaga lytica TaxID=979 RepID=UPI0004F91CE2|nr:translocation/assembly module TamB domain-containing protein [Cellulophaga lytica]AIM61401.1 N-acetyl-gamma-glutamyl-phosphate reductase [Cellulophaga lytica]